MCAHNMSHIEIVHMCVDWGLLSSFTWIVVVGSAMISRQNFPESFN